MKHSLGGLLDLPALDLLAGRDDRAVEHRPRSIQEMRCAAVELRNRGFLPRDVAAALGLSVGAVMQLIIGQPGR